ncbi:GNAT family N-acetyltransferase [Deinococcus sp. MIMF12]|uniref:GNAT family N-acetyltransferase n=1 Tax=Deinococcus rhizophilus TaxID=3049544 RepID=A0ABT7JDG0_9DEIO|nr:GNAT family N-acetyltransferase [Deinococcus rhizophilus]MDL2343090.1 GNAT family N-acetyltransferase [Deinococcus rhizophilus]
MTPSVRPFAPEDAPAWLALVNRVTGRQTTLDAFHAEEARRTSAHFSRRWVVGEREELRGLAHLYAFPFDPPGFLHASILVAPEARGQGPGQALWHTLEAAARKHGAAGLAADVAETDSGSLRWAERRGFGVHAHRFASELDLMTFGETPHLPALARARARGVAFTDPGAAGGRTVERYLAFVADRLTETPDLAGHPRWPSAQVREALRLDGHGRLDWLILAVGPGGHWLGTAAVIPQRDLAHNLLTATHPEARGQGLALPLKLHAIRRARAAGFRVMRTNNHSQNAPMLAVNRRLGFESRPGRYALHLPLAATSGA